MFDVETNEVFFLPYATKGNGWSETAESQNPWKTLDFVSAKEILMGDPAGRIIEELEYNMEKQENSF